jgi:hypothetical protein
MKIDATALQAIRAFDLWFISALDHRQEPMPPEFVDYLVNNYRNGLAIPDGDFLRCLADAMEADNNPHARSYWIFTGIIGVCKSVGCRVPSISQVHRAMLDRGAPVSRSTIVNWFQKHTIKPSKEKSGPKLGTKQRNPAAVRAKR